MKLLLQIWGQEKWPGWEWAAASRGGVQVYLSLVSRILIYILSLCAFDSTKLICGWESTTRVQQSPGRSCSSVWWFCSWCCADSCSRGRKSVHPGWVGPGSCICWCRCPMVVVEKVLSTFLCAAFTTISRAFFSSREQLPWHTEMQEHRTLSTTLL